MTDVTACSKMTVHDAGLAAYLEAVDETLDQLLAAECRQWSLVDPVVTRGFDLLRAFIANGGKRLRPAFAYWAFIGADGDSSDRRIIDLGASIEMLHTFALVHDDVMDGSALRRHQPTIHRSLEDDHATSRWCGEQRRFGEGGAVLLGDLAFVYADHLAADLPATVRAGFHDLKVELHIGQYLDLWSAAIGNRSPGQITDVIRYKTAKYSVERPLLLGAQLAMVGANTARPIDIDRLSGFGLAIGEAFQLRDDLLGVFGDPEITGKPIGDDFREGKQTMLIALARQWAGRCPDADRWLAVLDRLGAPDLDDGDIGDLRDIIEVSGSRDAIECRIASLSEEASVLLREVGLAEHAEAALVTLAVRSTRRSA